MKMFGFQWHVSEKCNLFCRHCYQKSSLPKVGDDFSKAVVMANRIFQSLETRQISVNLTGGEPLLYKRLFDLAKHLGTFENLKEMSIITNGTLIDKEIVEQINANPKIRQIKISLEAPLPGVNDSIRGQGNFDTVLKNMAYLLHNTEKSIVLMTTLSRHNIHLIEKTVEFATKTGLDGIIFERFVPIGRGKKMADSLLTPSEWRQAVFSILGASNIETDFEDLLPYRAFWIVMKRGKVLGLEGALCNLGDESMALMPDGTVYPCRRLPLEVGNVLRDPFEHILTGLSEFGYSAIKSKLDGNVCPSCWVDNCAGCRALAHAIHGNALDDDPSCPHVGK